MEATLPITLIVKAPNQQIEDQTIKCELSWTINKLKQHLSEVYPSRPAKHEQKLIYSGQLLKDTVTLKDVLRQFDDDQETHTVHLVCSTYKTPEKQMKTNQAEHPTQPLVTTTNIPNTNDITTNSTTTTTASSTTENQQHISAAFNFQQYGTNFPLQFSPELFYQTNNDGTLDDNQRRNLQIAWMHQAYIQYMAQYMHLTANSYYQQQQQIPQNSQQQPQQQQQQHPQENNLQRNHQDLDRDVWEQRDWLDIFYIMIRVMVLFSVVYFYSSPLRFFFVGFLGITLFFYQNGFFRNVNVNNNNNNVNNNNENQDGNVGVGGEQQGAPPAEQNTANIAQEPPSPPSRLMIIWTFFATFFASLLPEIPNAV